MTKCVAVLNVLLLLLIISLSTWLVGLYFSDPTINMKVKVQSDCMKALFYLSGVTSNSIFPFSRILHSLLVPQTTTDEVTTFSLTVPSLQPNRSRETVPIRLYAPKTPKIKFQKIPVLVWMHGGGFVFGSVKDKTNDKIARELADHFGFYVIAVEYSLAPENKFPDALEDCYSVLYFLNENKADWILGQGRFENFKPMALNNVFIGGIGAGGNLAVHSKILWQDRIGPSGSERLQETTYFPHHHFHQGSWLNLIGEILVTPDLMVSDDHYRNATYVLTADTNEILRELYLQKTVARVPGEPALSHEESLELQKSNPYVSVLSRPGSCNLRLHVFSMMPMNLFHLQGIALKDAVTSSGLRAEAASLYDVPYGSLITSQKSFRFFLDSAQQFTEKVLTEYYY